MYDGQIVAHTGVIQFPMRKGWKRVHRLVVLPDYQGVGVGVRFINAVSGIIAGEGFNVNLTTTTPALVGALKRSQDWSLVRKGVTEDAGGWSRLKGSGPKCLGLKSAHRRPTFSFNYRGA